MNNKKRTSRSNHKTTMALLALAVILLAASALGSTRAALTYFSDNYTAQLEVSHIGVTLGENGKDISSRDYAGSGDAWKESQGELLKDMLGKEEKVALGKKYDEKLTVRNSGAIDEYVRVSIVKSWTDKDGNKVTSLSPKLIDLGMTGNGWINDKNNSTEERIMLYYPRVLKSGEMAPAFADSIRIDDAVANKVTEETRIEDGHTVITTTFNYDGVNFNLEAEVDAVQTHNAKDAIKSAWGIDVNVASDGTISLQ